MGGVGVPLHTAWALKRSLEKEWTGDWRGSTGADGTVHVFLMAVTFARFSRKAFTGESKAFTAGACCAMAILIACVPPHMRHDAIVQALLLVLLRALQRCAKSWR